MGKKRTLIFLMVIPLLVSLLTYAGYATLKRAIRVDINDIVWSYRANEAFQIGNEYLLEASATYNTDLTLDDGNELVWSLSSEEDATIEERDDGYYLIPVKEGSATVVCSNAKGTYSESFNAIFYADGAIVINPVNNISNRSVKDALDYGEYEFVYADSTSAPSLERSTLELDVEVYYAADPDAALTYDVEGNISYDTSTSVISVQDSGEASVTISIVDAPSITSTFLLNVVDEGVNVRDYTDLLYCTNWASTPRPAVLQVNLGSLSETYRVSGTDSSGKPIYSQEKVSDEYELFGNYDFATRKFSFEDEIYTFETTYFREFLDQYNSYVSTNPSAGYSQASTEVLAGIHLQSDLYGNGFKINMHELCYPTNGTESGGKLRPGSADLFQGPLSFVGLGNLGSDQPLIVAYGQDNCGVFVDTDGVTIDGVYLQNADDTDNLYNYTYVGSVLDIEAEDVTVKNSVLQNGKDIVRAFSSDGLTIDNCSLQKGAEFLLHLGSNRANSYDTSKSFEYTDFSGSTTTYGFSEFFDSGKLDEAYTDAATGSYSVSATEATMDSIQDGLDNTSGMIASDGTYNYDSHVTVNDTSFYLSGIYSIAMDSAFNGGFLYDGSPSAVESVFSQYGLPVINPDKVGHTSYPVDLTLTGDTEFYDYKDVDEMDLSGLIEENVSTILISMGMIPSDVSITIDDFFPLKDVLLEQARNEGILYTVTDDSGTSNYVNTEIAWYGGGANLSTVTDLREDASDSSEAYELDFVTEAISSSPDTGNSRADAVVAIMRRAVFMVTGTHSFYTVTNRAVEDGEVPPLFGEEPPSLHSRTSGRTSA